MTPEKGWVFYPHDGGTPVLWTEPCPFPHTDEATCVEYVSTAAITAYGDARVKEEREACAKKLDSAAEMYIQYANKYPDADGDRAEIRAHTCRTQADALRTRGEG